MQRRVCTTFFRDSDHCLIARIGDTQNIGIQLLLILWSAVFSSDFTHKGLEHSTICNVTALHLPVPLLLQIPKRHNRRLSSGSTPPSRLNGLDPKTTSAISFVINLSISTRTGRTGFKYSCDFIHHVLAGVESARHIDSFVFYAGIGFDSDRRRYGSLQTNRSVNGNDLKASRSLRGHQWADSAACMMNCRVSLGCPKHLTKLTVRGSGQPF